MPTEENKNTTTQKPVSWPRLTPLIAAPEGGEGHWTDQARKYLLPQPGAALCDPASFKLKVKAMDAS